MVVKYNQCNDAGICSFMGPHLNKIASFFIETNIYVKIESNINTIIAPFENQGL